MGKRRGLDRPVVRGALAVLMCPLLVCVSVAGAASDPALIDAVRRQDRAAVQALLKKGIDVNAALPDGTTALHWAAYEDDLETAAVLLAAGAHVNATNEYGIAPLALACENRDAVLVKRLLAAGADPNTTALYTGVTALMACARTGAAEAIQALLTRGARVNARERAHLQTALMWAAAERHSDAVRVLIEGGADVTARSAIRHVFVSAGFEPTAPDSDKQRSIFEVDFGGYTPLLFAARSGDVASARFLLAAGANANDGAPDGTSALVVAVLSGHRELAQLLLESGADPNAAGAGYTPLHAAVLQGDPAVVGALLARGANPNVAIVRGTPVPRYSKTLFLSGSTIGATPFLLAAQFDEPDIMRALVEHGANPLLAKPDGTTPLMAAAGVGWDSDRRERLVDPAERELAMLQDPDSRRMMGSGIRAVRLAVELGADVNATNKAGETALRGATRHGFQSVAQFLSAHGAR